MIVLPKEKVTYKKIKEYIEAKYDLKVHNAYIAEVKRNWVFRCMMLQMRVEELKQPSKHPMMEKEEEIKDGLNHFYTNDTGRKYEWVITL
ncbi:MAG: hypothetical protein ACI4SS_00340 [Clostridia bacterium]